MTVPPLPHPASPSKRRMWLPVLAAAALSGVVAAVALAYVAGRGSDPPADAGATPTAAATMTVRGQMQLNLPGFEWDEGRGCWGRGGYDDIRGGAQVVVTDGSGATIAVGQLDKGTPTKRADDPTRAESCTFTFTVADVPAGRAFYGIEVSHRGRVQFAENRLHETIQLALN